ncbi:MAG TPA: efflux RND transporter permease subunit [Vicinamibacterales bacterium]|nr:efflux RND transporter permease subunit [Vicinamibacterales bacterium]
MHGSATAIPALALPFSLLGTAAIMAVLGYSLDNLSMMALILSIGFVVDDAIVMLENVVRHMEQGESAFDAALTGSKEIGSTSGHGGSRRRSRGCPNCRTCRTTWRCAVRASTW